MKENGVIRSEIIIQKDVLYFKIIVLNIDAATLTEKIIEENNEFSWNPLFNTDNGFVFIPLNYIKNSIITINDIL